jgi:hypothetical protein
MAKNEFPIHNFYQAFGKFCESQKMRITHDRSDQNTRLVPISKNDKPQYGAELVISDDGLDALIDALIKIRDEDYERWANRKLMDKFLNRRN